MAITAGVNNDVVKGVCAIATKTFGIEEVQNLGKPLLLLHGTGDTCIPSESSERLYAQAKEPKDLVLYDGDIHGLTHHSKEACEKVLSWSVQVLSDTYTDTPSSKCLSPLGEDIK